MARSVVHLALRATAFACAVGLGLCARDRADQMRKGAPAQDSLLYLPPSHQLPALSLGYKEALADLIWLRAVVFAGTAANGAKLDWLDRYVHAIHTLAPNFRRPYVWGGVVSIYNGQEISKEMLDQAVQILREGLRNFPEDHEILFNLGMILYRDYQSLQTMDAQAVEAFKQEGAEMIRKAAAFGAPPLIAQLAASLEHQGSDKALQAEFLKRQLMRAQDEGLILLLRKKIKDLGEADYLSVIEENRRKFLQAHEQELPYTSKALFSLLEQPALQLPAPSLQAPDKP